ncbi:CD1871A family CXXC motif-containing protein [Acutalibacter muris]|nr:CD1871A family CXXC motif-containing protein [Acutalibacter muris]
MKSKAFTAVRYGLLALAIAFIVIGLLGRGHIEVLQKAVKICLECIGIG